MTATAAHAPVVGSDRTTQPKRSGGLLGSIGHDIPLPLPVPDWSKPIILALLVVSIGFGARARVTSSRARRLERKQQALTADLDAMQLALVPEIPNRLGEVEIAVAYRPADGPAAGGDFYDAFALPGARVAVILGDVSGHGRVALAHAARMRYTVRAYVEAGLAPRSALRLANDVIGQSEDGLFTTVVVAVYEPSTASLTYATAGHPAPLTLGPAAHEPVASPASPPLGWGFPTGRRQTRIPFPSGARACFFSDGLVEARTDHELLGRRRLAAMFAEASRPQSARALLDQVQDHAREIRDDMAACIIESVSGPVAGGADTWLEELEIDADPLSLGGACRFLEACGVAKDQIGPVIDRAQIIASENGLAVVSVTSASRSRDATASVQPAPTPTLVPEPKTAALTRASLLTPMWPTSPMRA